MTIRIASKYSFYDIEASGLYKGSFPVEIAWSIFGEVNSVLVRPDDHWDIDKWDPVAQSIHGHSIHLLKKDGIKPIKIASTLNSTFKSGVVYSDNPDRDIEWTDMIFDASSLNRTFEIRTIGNLLGSLGVSANTAYDAFSNARHTKPPVGVASQGVKHLKAVIDDLQKNGILKP